MQRTIETGKRLECRDGISYEILTSGDIELTVQCILTTFTLGEPKCRALGITRDDGLDYATIYCVRAAEQGMSIIARDMDTSKIIGFAINSDFMSEPPDGIDGISPKLYPIASITEALEKKFLDKYTIGRGELLYQHLIGVLPAYSGRNIALTVGTISWELALENGFKGVIAECTGPISQHLAIQKTDYREVASINYGEFVYCGQKIFQHVTDCKSTKLLLKML